MDSYWLRGMRGCGMRSGITFGITPSDKARLEAIIAARGSPQKHVWRARIVLLSGDGAGTIAIMAATGKSKTCVWRWQEQFMAEGVAWVLVNVATGCIRIGVPWWCHPQISGAFAAWIVTWASSRPSLLC